MSSIHPSISKSLCVSVHHPLGVPIVHHGDGGGGGGGPGAGVDNLLLEDAFNLLIESGDALILE